MIATAIPLPAGAAVKLILAPPEGATFWRVLRRTDPTAFTGPDDAGAVLITDLSTANFLVDIDGLVDGTEIYYRDYAWVDNAWVAGTPVGCTPAPSYGMGAPDPQQIVLARVQEALDYEIAQGWLEVSAGSVKVVTAPFGLATENISLPAVSVHYDNGNSDARVLGDELPLPLANLPGGAWDGYQGYYKRVRLGVTGASLNGDERIALRMSIERAIVANLGVFASQGMILCDFSQTDEEDQQAPNAAIYYTRGMFECTVPVWTSDTGAIVTDVNLTADVGTIPEGVPDYVRSDTG